MVGAVSDYFEVGDNVSSPIDGDGLVVNVQYWGVEAGRRVSVRYPHGIVSYPESVALRRLEIR